MSIMRVGLPEGSHACCPAPLRLQPREMPLRHWPSGWPPPGSLHPHGPALCWQFPPKPPSQYAASLICYPLAHTVPLRLPCVSHTVTSEPVSKFILNRAESDPFTISFCVGAPECFPAETHSILCWDKDASHSQTAEKKTRVHVLREKMRRQIRQKR